MPAITAQQFIDALGRLEADRDAGPIAGLHREDAVLSNPHIRIADGPDAPRRFWQAYRDSFDKVRSEFDAVLEGEDAIMLEWASDGAIAGQPVHYRGVTVLHLADGAIARVRTYFDPASLGQQIAPAGADAAE